MSALLPKIESILFVASKPLSFATLAKTLGGDVADIEDAVVQLQHTYNHDACGIHVLVNGQEVQMTTNPAHAELAEQFVKSEALGELTKAQLETLTVIAYRGPIGRPELEQIRGVNCAIILRNLLMRGLIVESDDTNSIVPLYLLSLSALAHLGISRVDELPDYATLHTHPHLDREQLEQRNS